MKKTVFMLLFVTMVSIALCAHSPICFCYDNADGTITCEGGFSDGSSAEGVELRVEDKDGKVLIKGKFNKDSEFTFKKPKVKFTIIFDAGPGHVLKIDSSKIK